jgi:hypothetical protein
MRVRIRTTIAPRRLAPPARYPTPSPIDTARTAGTRGGEIAHIGFHKSFIFSSKNLHKISMFASCFSPLIMISFGHMGVVTSRPLLISVGNHTGIDLKARIGLRIAMCGFILHLMS